MQPPGCRVAHNAIVLPMLPLRAWAHHIDMSLHIHVLMISLASLAQGVGAALSGAIKCADWAIARNPLVHMIECELPSNIRQLTVPIWQFCTSVCMLVCMPSYASTCRYECTRWLQQGWMWTSQGWDEQFRLPCLSGVRFLSKVGLYFKYQMAKPLRPTMK